MGKKYKEASVQAKWNRDTIMEAIQTCGARSEFKKRYGQAYLQMRRHGWQDLLAALPSRNAPYWTYERASELVSKCSTRFQLRSSYPGAYHAIIKHGWDDLLSSLPEISNLPETTLWCVYCWQFHGMHTVYIGLTCDYERRINEELRYSSASPVHDYIEQTGCTYSVHRLHSNLGATDAADLERAYIAKYRADGYTLLNRNQGGSLGRYNGLCEPRMSDDELLETIFRKFSSYKDLRVNGQSLLNQARKRGLKSAITDILVPKPSTRPKYDKAELEQKVAKCNGNREQFKNMYPDEWHYIGTHALKRHLFPRNVKPKITVEYSYDDILDAATQVNARTLRHAEAGKLFGISWTKFRRLCNSMGIYLRSSAYIPKGHGWTKEKLVAAILDKCQTVKDLRKNDALRVAAYRHGIYNEVVSMLQRSKRTHITREETMQVASKCHTLNEFIKNYPSEYTTCRNNGWTDILDGLSRTYRQSDLITDEAIRTALAQCKTRTEFNIRFRSESNAAKKRGIYNELVKNLPKQTGKCVNKK